MRVRMALFNTSTSLRNFEFPVPSLNFLTDTTAKAVTAERIATADNISTSVNAARHLEIFRFNIFIFAIITINIDPFL